MRLGGGGVGECGGGTVYCGQPNPATVTAVGRFIIAQLIVVMICKVLRLCLT